MVDWSTGRMGYYVEQRWDDENKCWLNGWGPVRWLPFQEKAMRHLFTLDERGKLPFSQLYWIDGGKTAKTFMQGAFGQWCGMFLERSADILVSANSLTQAGVRAYKEIRKSLQHNPYRSVIAAVHRSRIEFKATGNVMMPVSTNAGSVAGSNPVAILKDEGHAQHGENARDLNAELKPSPTRLNSVVISVSYPPFLDDDAPLNEVLNRLFHEDGTPRYEDGVEKVFPNEDIPLYRRGTMYCWWNNDMMRYPWITQAFLAEQRDNPETSMAQYLRVWEAKRVQREDAFMPMDKWDMCEDPDHRRLTADDRGVPMCGAVDIGVVHDLTALIFRGYDVATDSFPLYLDYILHPKAFIGNPDDIIAEAERIILLVHHTHNLLAMGYDPSQFRSSADRLKKAGVRMVEFTQNNSRTDADTHFYGLIKQKKLRNYPGAIELRRHVQNAVGSENSVGAIRLDKRKASSPIDAAVGDSMACAMVRDFRWKFVQLAGRRRAIVAQPPILNPFEIIFQLGKR